MAAKKKTRKSRRPDPKRPVGRPPKLDAELIKRLTDLIRMGNYIEVACAGVGINRELMYKWMRDGHDQRVGLKRDLVEAFQKAVAEAEMRDVYRLDGFAAKESKVLMWRLERRWPTRWSRREQLAIQHNGGEASPVQIQAHRERLIEIVETPETRDAVRLLAAAMVPKREREKDVVEGEILE